MANHSSFVMRGGSAPTLGFGLGPRPSNLRTIEEEPTMSYSALNDGQGSQIFASNYGRGSQLSSLPKIEEAPAASLAPTNYGPGSQAFDFRTAEKEATTSLSTLVEESTVCFDTHSRGPMPLDATGAIIHEGLTNAGFILDCMDWDLIDDYTGIWKTDKLPPVHYFNCLRFWAWAHSKDRRNVIDIREVPLPKKNSVPHEVHVNAMQSAYGIWAEEYLSKQKQDMFGARPLPAPVGSENNQIWGDNILSRPEPHCVTPTEGSQSPSTGGVPLHSTSQSKPGYNDRFGWNGSSNVGLSATPSRNDSVITATESPTATMPSRRGTAFSSTSSGSPTKHVRHGRQLSALAPTFRPAATNTAAPLSSRAALPNIPGQLPGTFDILIGNNRSNFTCLMITDVPFNVTVNEILTHLKLGEREGLVHYGPDNPAIHIIQDRADSKTHEVYVEMLSYEAALRVIRDMPRRGVKIGSTGGSRKIRVDLCAPDMMMRAIFPRPSRNHLDQFRWMGFLPDLNSIPDSFIGYVSPEDLHNAREWAEHPRKAKHADDAPQRVYEFMITTLIHLPKDPAAYGRLKGWRDVQDLVDRLFNTVTSMIRTLNTIIDDSRAAEGRHIKREHIHLLNYRLLKKFNQTCFDFPLFSNAQKSQILAGL